MGRGFEAKGVRLGANEGVSLARGSVHKMVFEEDMLLSMRMLLPPVVD